MPDGVIGMFAAVIGVGILALVLGGGIMPLLVCGAVCWALFHVACGLYG